MEKFFTRLLEQNVGNVDEAISINATDKEIKEYNDSVVFARRSILRSSELLGAYTFAKGGDKARSKKLGQIQKLFDELLKLLSDKDIQSLVSEKV